MKRWQMIKEEDFKELVKGIDVDLPSCINNIRSMSKTIDIYEYHKSEAYRLIKKNEPKSSREAMELVFQPSEEIYFDKLSIQAHIQSAIYNSRALYDIFSHLINKIFLNGKIRVNDCSIGKVKEKLKDGRFKLALSSIIETESYLYINAFVNTIKHRDLVELTASIDFVNSRSGIKFNEFQYNQKTFESLWAVEVLTHSLNAKNDMIDLFNVFKNNLV